MSMKKYEEWNANHKHDNPPREKIVKLGRKITDVAGHIFGGVKVEDPEYWGLAEIVSDEMADIALAMKKRTPYTFKELCDLCKVSKDQEEHFQKTLDEMSYLGLLEYDYGYHYDHHGRTAPQSERRYILPMFVPGSAELFNMEELPDRSNPRLEDHPDVAAFLYAGHGIYLGGESPLWGRCRNCQPLANIKGVHREVESERRWRQNSGPRNTNHIRHITGMSVQNNTKS